MHSYTTCYTHMCMLALFVDVTPITEFMSFPGFLAKVGEYKGEALEPMAAKAFLDANPDTLILDVQVHHASVKWSVLSVMPTLQLFMLHPSGPGQ